MAFLLFEDAARFDLLPFTYTRPVYALRSGILTLLERWEKVLDAPVAGLPFDYLSAGFPTAASPASATWINGRTLPDEDFVRVVRNTRPGTYTLSPDGQVLTAAFEKEIKGPFNGLVTEAWLAGQGLTPKTLTSAPRMIAALPDLFRMAADNIRFDFSLLTQDGHHHPIRDPHTRIYGADNLFVAEGVQVRAAIINAEDGPIYIGPGMKVQEGAIIHGTHGFHSHGTVAMGAKLRGDSAFGPFVKVGGEVGNAVIMGYSSKGHDGYLGNSVLGYWCNLGADTNTSNLKNNYDQVKLWHYPTGRFKGTGLQFCGLMMGDHSKCSINTMFNTGTVVGVSANIFGAGFPRNFVPDFSWGGAGGLVTYQLRKALETAERVIQRRDMQLSDGEKAILAHVFELTSSHRNWDTLNT